MILTVWKCKIRAHSLQYRNTSERISRIEVLNLQQLITATFWDNRQFSIRIPKYCFLKNTHRSTIFITFKFVINQSTPLSLLNSFLQTITYSFFYQCSQISIQETPIFLSLIKLYFTKEWFVYWKKGRPKNVVCWFKKICELQK